MCAQRRLRSPWASAQSDQSFRCPHDESLVSSLPTERTAKTQIRLGGCPGWSESSLGAQVSLLVLSCRVQIFSFRQWIEFHRDCFDTQNILIAIHQLSTSLCNCSECHRRVNKSLNHQRRDSFLLITFSVSPKPKSWKTNKLKKKKTGDGQVFASNNSLSKVCFSRRSHQTWVVTF